MLTISKQKAKLCFDDRKNFDIETKQAWSLFIEKFSKLIEWGCFSKNQSETMVSMTKFKNQEAKQTKVVLKDKIMEGKQIQSLLKIDVRYEFFQNHSKANQN